MVGETAGEWEYVESLLAAGEYDTVDSLLAAAELAGDTRRAFHELQTAHLVAWAEESSRAGNTATLVRCLRRLAEAPLPDSILLRVCPLIDITYRTQLVTDNIVADYAPRFFPEGRKIVFFSRLEREGLEHLSRTLDIRYQTQICVFDLASGATEVISDGRASEFFPDISPDGRTIVCQRADGDTLKGEWTAASGSYLYLYDLETGEGRKLSEKISTGQCPRFSPAGDEVVFVTGAFGDEGTISSINLETGELTSRYCYEDILHSDKPGGVFYPSLPADETKLVFQAGFQLYKGVYVSDEFGRNMRRLSPRRREWSDDAREWHPAVSPDGRRIVFIAEGPEGEELFFRNIDGTGRRQITADGQNKMFPAYSPNGRFVAYGAKEQDRSDADYEIYMLDLAAAAYREQIAEWAQQNARKPGIQLEF